MKPLDHSNKLVDTSFSASKYKKFKGIAKQKTLGQESSLNSKAYNLGNGMKNQSFSSKVKDKLLTPQSSKNSIRTPMSIKHQTHRKSQIPKVLKLIDELMV